MDRLGSMGARPNNLPLQLSSFIGRAHEIAEVKRLIAESRLQGRVGAAKHAWRWKTWIVNEAQHEAGGIYLFDDEASLQAFLDGPIVASLKSDPTLNVSLKSFDVSRGLSEVARAPIEDGVRA